MKMIVAGDVCPRNRVQEFVEKGNYEFLFGEVRPLIKSADYSIVNFESPVVQGEAIPIIKQGPNLRCTSKMVNAIQWAGFKGVTLANNHFLDYGAKGVDDTISTLDSLNIDHVGAGANIAEASQILYKEVAGQKLAIINCCEHEFSIATDESPGCNPLNPVQQYYAIKEAKVKADYVVIIVHGGHELFQLPSPRMVETYRFFVDAGADAVVNHHQHCYSGYETYKGCPIIYGLGNFLFDISPVRTNDSWNYGLVLELNLVDTERKFKLYPYCQCAEEPKIKLLPENWFDQNLVEINALISNKERLGVAVNTYYEQSSKTYENLFEPLQNKYYFKAKHHGWLPSFINKRNVVSIANYVYCESHRDRFSWWLDKFIHDYNPKTLVSR